MAWSRKQLEQLAEQAAAKHGVDPAIFLKQIGAESGWRVDARSPAGATGIAQFMPATAKGMGVDPLDPRSALFGAARYMRNSLDQFGGDYRLALAAYNAGGGNARRALKSFPETIAYVNKILGKNAPKSGARLGLGSSPSEAAPSPLGSTGGLTKAPSPYAGLAKLSNSPRTQKALGLLAAIDSRQVAAEPAPAPQIQPGSLGTGPVPKGAPPRKKGEPGWRYLQRVGQSMFGLQNDPGDSQSTGGRHSAGSEHYDGRAIDFGDARNDPADIKRFLAWARRRGFDAIWEGDHGHVSLPGSGI